MKKKDDEYYDGFYAGRQRGISETEERLKLTWKDIELIDNILQEGRKHVGKQRIRISDFYSDVLDIFNKETHREQ